ncbi:MAG: zinc-finger domain-containing protein [Pseudomonadota bacterium]|nr:zinc-finger domain-containing protein [Pseudomonadota bacterium]
MSTDKTAASERRIALEDLPLHCPTDDSPLWSAHPRVFLPIEDAGEVLCPYCGTRYILVGDD